MNFKFLPAVFALSFHMLVTPPDLWAKGVALPYSERTKAYGGWSTTVRGDIRTVGMAGSTVGLADTFIASLDNPAGLAMTLNSGDINITENLLHDNRIQEYTATIPTSSFGLAAMFYPWSFSVGYRSPHRESQVYTLPTAPSTEATLDLMVREIHASAARVFWKNRISLGVGVNLGYAKSEAEFANRPDLDSLHYDYEFGATMGAMFRLPARFLLGVSHTFPMRYAFNAAEDVTPGLPGFAQPVLLPRHYDLGLGWIPNRFFRADASLQWVGATAGAALLRDEGVNVGEQKTIQPKMGVAYQWADFNEFRGTAFGGMYWEHSRLQGYGSRFHKTLGMELRPWIFSLGWGLDWSNGYKNYIVSAGVHLIRTLQKQDILPTPWRPAPAGWFPHPLRYSDEGLARPLQKNWQQRGPRIDPIQAGLDIPNKLEEKISKTTEEVLNVFTAEQPTPKKKKNKKRFKKK